MIVNRISAAQRFVGVFRISFHQNPRNLAAHHHQHRAMIHLKPNTTLVNGQWIGAHDCKHFAVLNPATGETVANVPDMGEVDAQRAIESARAAFESEGWSNLSAKERSGLLKVHQNKILSICTKSMCCITFAWLILSLFSSVVEVLCLRCSQTNDLLVLRRAN